MAAVRLSIRQTQKLKDAFNRVRDVSPGLWCWCLAGVMEYEEGVRFLYAVVLQKSFYVLVFSPNWRKYTTLWCDLSNFRSLIVVPLQSSFIWQSDESITQKNCLFLPPPLWKPRLQFRKTIFKNQPEKIVSINYITDKGTIEWPTK